MAPSFQPAALTAVDLWERAARTAARAQDSGALEPIETRVERVEDAGLPFLVRVATAAPRKPRGLVRSADPFLPPYQPGLWVGDLSATHAVLLNKYNVLPHHLLIVTRRFEPQTTLLTAADFTALWTALAGADALGFYNAGSEAGASQPHKHLQVVPLPLAPGFPELPMAPLFQRHATGGRIPELPFPLVMAPAPRRWLRDPATAGAEAREVYRELLQAVGRAGVPGPYNLLATRQWLWLVPRRGQAFDGLSVNALGFAGALLVRDSEQLARLRRYGPMRVLREVAGCER